MVGAVPQKLRYIELAGGMSHLTVPDKLTVEPDVEAGGNALEVQKCARGSGILLVGEVVEVSAAGILFGNIKNPRNKTPPGCLCITHRQPGGGEFLRLNLYQRFLYAQRHLLIAANLFGRGGKQRCQSFQSFYQCLE